PRTRLKTYLQLAVATRQLSYQPIDRSRLVRNLSQKPDLPLAPALRERYRMLQLRRIKRHKSLDILPHGPSSMPEARLRPPQPPPILLLKGRTTTLSGVITSRASGLAEPLISSEVCERSLKHANVEPIWNLLQGTAPAWHLSCCFN